MGKMSSISRTLTHAAVAIAIALCSASLSMAQTDSRSGADSASKEQIVLKSKIAELQAKLSKLESTQQGHAASPGAVATKGSKGCCAGGASGNGSGMTGSNGNAPEGLAQASPASEPSSSAGSEHPMGGGGMEGSMEKGEGMMGGTSASPGGMPMGHKMGGGMGGMGGGGMGGGEMQRGTSGAQPEASPSAGMGGMKDEM